MTSTHKEKLKKNKRPRYTGERLVENHKLLSPQRTENLARFHYFLNYLSNGNVLDYGCGGGEGSYYLSTNSNSRVLGMDISLETIQHASTTYKNDHLAFLCGNVLSPALRHQVFNGIISVEVIEHIQDADKYLSNVITLLKKDGLFLLTTPNRLISSPTPGSLWPDHVKEYESTELRNLLNNYFASVKILGEYIPVYEENPFRKLVHKFSPWFKPILPRWVRIRALPLLFSLIQSDLTFQDITITSVNIDDCPTLVAICKQPIKKQILTPKREE